MKKSKRQGQVKNTWVREVKDSGLYSNTVRLFVQKQEVRSLKFVWTMYCGNYEKASLKVYDLH